MALQRMQVVSILRRVVIGEGSYKLNVFSSVIPFFLFDVFLVTKGLSIWFVHVPLAIHPHWWFFLFA